MEIILTTKQTDCERRQTEWHILFISIIKRISRLNSCFLAVCKHSTLPNLYHLYLFVSWICKFFKFVSLSLTRVQAVKCISTTWCVLKRWPRKLGIWQRAWPILNRRQPLDRWSSRAATNQSSGISFTIIPWYMAERRIYVEIKLDEEFQYCSSSSKF